MARSRNTEPQTVTRDAVDILVDTLNTIAGAAFVRDAWDNKAPDDYGVVEITGQANSLWADNHMLEQILSVRVHWYATGGGDEMVGKVQAKLNDAVDGYSLPLHEFLFDIAKNHWYWDCQIIGPLQWEEVITDGAVGS